MALNVPSLDDRTYADLVEEGVQIIPQYAPEWTDHNASDPGITLLELFAYVTEMSVYRIDRSSEASRRKYLELIVGKGAAAEAAGSLEGGIGRAVAEIRRPYRAVSIDDYERLAYEAARTDDTVWIAGVRCFGRLNVDAPTDEERLRERPGHVSVVFVPVDPWMDQAAIGSIRGRIVRDLEPRRLLTTRLHVASARYLDIAIRVHAEATGRADAAFEHSLRRTVAAFLDPREGGPDGSGYPLGRALYAFDLHRLLDPLPGVSRLHPLVLEAPGARLLRGEESGEPVAVQLMPWELPRVRPSDIRVTVTSQRSAR